MALSQTQLSNTVTSSPDVYLDEVVWASSTESEKESFAITISMAIQSSLPDDAYVDFRSATNKDVIA